MNCIHHNHQISELRHPISRKAGLIIMLVKIALAEAVALDLSVSSLIGEAEHLCIAYEDLIELCISRRYESDRSDLSERRRMFMYIYHRGKDIYFILRRYVSNHITGDNPIDIRLM